MNNMLTFSSKIEIYEWFQQIQGWNRMDFLCNLIHLCNPFELRFIGSCIEDMAQTDYNCLRDQEIKANSAEHLDHFINKCASVDEFRSHISVCISLLQSSNYKVAGKLAELLDNKLDGLNLEHLMQAGLDAEVEQWMLMLTLASYHPAFSFEKKLNFKSKLSEYEKLKKGERKLGFGSRCYRGHHYPQSQHSGPKYNDCDDSDWRTDFNPSNVQPFQHFPSMHHHRGYGHGYSNFQQEPFGASNNGPPHGFQEGFSRPQNFMQRPSNFPNTLMPSSGMGDTNYYEKQMDYNKMPPRNNIPNFHSNADFMPLGFTKPPRQDRRPFHSGGGHGRTSPTLWHDPNNNNIRNSAPPHSNVFPMTTVCNSSEQNITVSTAASAANSIPTSTKVVYQAQPRSTAQQASDNKSNASTTNSKERHFVTIPNSERTDQHAKTISNRTQYETLNSFQNVNNQHNFVNNHNPQRHMSNNVRLPPKKEYNGNYTNHPDRTNHASVSTVNLHQENEQPLPESDQSEPNLPKPESELLPSTLESKLGLRPVKVSVNIIAKNKTDDLKNSTSFKLQIDWSDGSATDCEKSVDEMVDFYEQIVGKLGNSNSNTDFLIRQNNKIVEKRKELEAIFSEILSSSSTNIESVVSFFKSSSNNIMPKQTTTTTILPLKKRRVKPGSKFMENQSTSSSSSSTASPPLSYNMRSRIMSPPSKIRPESSISPLSNNGGKSASSVLSSPASLSTTTSHIDEDDNTSSGDCSDPRNDPYLKLYYWLHDRSLAHLYTYLKKYTFQQFCKLEKSEIESISNIGTEEKAIVNQHIANMPGNCSEETAPLEIDMGLLTLTQTSIPNADGMSSNTSIPSADGPLLDEISRNRSEDEKSGSTSHSVPFEIPDSSTDTIQAVASNSCFSFEFDSTVATVETTPRSSKPVSENEAENGKDIAFDFNSGSNRSIEPTRAWSQTDISPNEYPQASTAQLYFPSKSAPPFPQMTYCAKVVHPEHFTINQMMPVLSCYHQPQTVISRHIPHTGTTPVSGSIPVLTQGVTTLPSPMGLKTPQYAYTISSSSNPPMTREPTVMYTVPYYSMYPMTSPSGEFPTMPLPQQPQMLYMGKSVSPNSTQQNFPTQDNENSKNATSSSSSSDQDTASKDLPPPLNLEGYIPAEDVVSNRPGAGPTNCYYNPAPSGFISGSFAAIPPPLPPQHNPIGTTYVEPASVATNKPEPTQSNTRSSENLPNGYPEPIPDVAFASPQILPRNMGTLLTDPCDNRQGKLLSTSCYNCGREGHEAAGCTEPIAVEVLGTDFQLKMSQPSHRRGND